MHRTKTKRPLQNLPNWARDRRMSFINTLEKKLGHFAIPHVVRILALFQLAVWFMCFIRPEFVSTLLLSKHLILQGEIWRLVTWVLYLGPIDPIWIFFEIYLLFLFGDALEEAWGAFRLNLYIFGGILAVIMQTMLFSSEQALPTGFIKVMPKEVADLLATIVQNPYQTQFFSSTLLFAFACFVPNYEILLYFILPIKVKWLALLTAITLALTFISSPSARLPILFSVLNFLVAFGPALIKMLKQKAIVVERRSRFESAQIPRGDFFHQCAECKKTELDDKTLDFRVTADGEEYCSVCRPRKTA